MQHNTILNAPFIREMTETTDNLYRLGWDERNGGNISVLLNEADLKPCGNFNEKFGTVPLAFNARKLAGRYLLVTASGTYFKNISKNPLASLGILRVSADGASADVVWGFADNSRPTSELPAHLLSHSARLAADAQHRVIMHTHATHLIAMTFTHSLNEADFTRTLWEMCTECLVVFPDGVGIIPWLVPGTDDIGKATADKMAGCRLVLWPHHGIYGAGRTMDETFGLIETAEKAAEVYTYVCAQGGRRQTISAEQLGELARAFGVTPRRGIID
jgi:rhamnulose-1-phosphate aldolase